jgi:hypothetical protein
MHIAAAQSSCSGAFAGMRDGERNPLKPLEFAATVGDAARVTPLFAS